MAGYKFAVPADHCGRFHDQHDLAQSSAVEGTRQHGQDRPVRRGEPGVFDLSLEDKDLMAKGENFCVTLVTGHEQQSETSDQQPEQV